MGAATGVVTVTARITARPGRQEALRAVMAPLVRATRAEPGCLRYDLLVAGDDPCAFLMFEEWVSAQALATHQQSAHIAAFRAAAEPLLEGSVVRTFADVDVAGRRA
jgi:quinol monooxygenase YgiN